MAQRFPPRESSRSSLFSAYEAQTASTRSIKSQSPLPYPSYPLNPSSGYPSRPSSSNANINPAFAAYPGAQGPSGANFRTATPNTRGQYSASVLESLESQNEEHMEGMLGKVRMLKDITTAIGDEIRSSTTLAESMNEGFERTSARLKGTMRRMLRMADKTGVGWRVWLGFFAFVILLFWYVRYF